MSDGSGTSRYYVDPLNRLGQSVSGSGQTVTYSYDLAGHLIAIAYPQPNEQVTRSYDAAGRLTDVADWQTNDVQFTYDADGNQTSAVFRRGGAVVGTDAYAFDAADRMTSISDSTPTVSKYLQLNYQREAMGQVLSDGTSDFAYDSNNRITTAGSTAYSYDAGDNLTQTGPATMGYDAANEMTTRGAAQYSYDRLGSRSSATTGVSNASYSFDQASRLVAFAPPSIVSGAAPGACTVACPSEVAWDYSYNGDGLRMSKTSVASAVSGAITPPVQPTIYTWDVAEQLPLLLEEQTGTSGLTDYVTGPPRPPIEEIHAPGQATFLHGDQLGSVRALTDQTGALVATNSYDAVGLLTSSTMPSTVANDFGFSGQYTDAESGMLYLRARYYDPSTADFLTRDPAVAMTRGPYGYVGDNPLNQTDPTGLYIVGV